MRSGEESADGESESDGTNRDVAMSKGVKAAHELEGRQGRSDIVWGRKGRRKRVEEEGRGQEEGRERERPETERKGEGTNAWVTASHILWCSFHREDGEMRAGRYGGTAVRLCTGCMYGTVRYYYLRTIHCRLQAGILYAQTSRKIHSIGQTVLVKQSPEEPNTLHRPHG